MHYLQRSTQLHDRHETLNASGFDEALSDLSSITEDDESSGSETDAKAIMNACEGRPIEIAVLPNAVRAVKRPLPARVCKDKALKRASPSISGLGFA